MPASAGSGPGLRARILPAILGVVIYCGLMAISQTASGTGDFGMFVYNHYFLALTEGRFDVPARVITVEGHYTADGTAYVYHGLAPVLTRALAWPFVDLRQVSLAVPTVLAFALAGSAAIHAMCLRILAWVGPPDRDRADGLALTVGIMAWVASPGIVLASNASLYHEPIAAAYAFAALWMWLAAEVVVLNRPLRPLLIPLALAAGLTVHARPHIALGLYLGTVLLILLRARAEGYVRQPRRPALALGLMFTFGAALLAVNAARFGDPFRLFSGTEVELLWGFYFWGVYTEDTVRVAQAAADQGSFHTGWMLPNGLLYLFDLPRGLSPVDLGALHRSLTAPFGYVGIETPRLGIVFAWAPWIVLIVLWLRRPRAPWGGLVLPLAGLAGFLFILAFTTVTLRYRADLWPLIGGLSALALARVAAEVNTGKRHGRQLVTSLVVGLLVSFGMQNLMLPYRIPVADGLSDWSYETCVERAQVQGFAPEVTEKICAL